MQVEDEDDELLMGLLTVGGQTPHLGDDLQSDVLRPDMDVTYRDAEVVTNADDDNGGRADGGAADLPGSDDNDVGGFGDVEQQPNEERITRPMLTKYERARLLGVRAQQLSAGAVPVVEPEGLIDPMAIAEKELLAFRIPMVLRRYLPDGSFEDWAISEFKPKLHDEEEEEEDEEDDNDAMDIDDQ